MLSSRGALQTFIATLVFFVAFYVLLVPLPPYLARIGLDDWQIGLVLGSFGVAAVLGRPLAGLASDRFGRQAVMVAGVVSFIVGLAAVLVTTQMIMLMVARVLQALGYVLVTTAATARITDLSAPEKRGAAIAQFGIAANLAMTLTPASTDAALRILTDVQIFIGAMVVAAVSGALALGFRERGESRATAQDRRLWILPPAIRQPWLAAVLLGVGFGVWLQFLPLLTIRRAVDATGLLYAIYGASIIVTRIVSGPWQDRGRERQLLVVGFAAVSISLGLFAFTQSLAYYMVATALMAVGGGLLHPLLMALHVRYMPAELRGRAVSTFYLGFDMGNGLGVWILGFALQWWGLTALFGLAMVSGLLGLALSLVRASGWQMQVPGLSADSL